MFELKYKFVLGLGMVIGLSLGLTAHAQAPLGLRPPGPPPGQNPLVASQQEAGDAVQRAYDALRRSAVLSKTASDGTGSILAQGRDTYQQALSQYQASNFVGARESAMAAEDLARAAEQIATANLLESASGQLQLPVPPNGSAIAVQTEQTYQDLARVTEHSVRLTDDLSTTGVSASSTTQVRPLLEQSRRLQQRAQSLLTGNKPEQASAMARASDALLAAADHLNQRALIASGMIPAQPAPPPPAPGMAAPPPPPDGAQPPPPADPNGPPPPQ